MERKKILIIEDDVFFRDLLLKKFVKEGFDVFTAGDGKEAFDYLVSNSPELIILDLILPGLSGYEILSILKKDKKTLGIPVVVLSNLGQQEEINRAMGLGAADFMVKVNFTLEEVVAKVRKIFKEKYL